MAHIEVLDKVTIDKIAAGEVIERPASIVKELVENAIDAGATAIVVEIKEGGISLIRITDNGCGIAKEEVPAAFLRHSTSKIRRVEDLSEITSLGFRGEALSSIAAIAQVELITKTREDTFGTKYVIEGGVEKSIEDVGAPDGTTFLVRQIFYNTPARRKFLRTPMTEASHVGELMIRLALSHPEISFQFLNNGQSKLHTSGNGNVKDIIYHIYGREIANELIPVDLDVNGIRIDGFLGKPQISRGNRNFENYFINGRYVKSNLISKAIEDAYKGFTMQHKYPFVTLYMKMDGRTIDVNVHPTKMELRFSRQQEVYNAVYETVVKRLKEPELIPVVEVPDPVEFSTAQIAPEREPKKADAVPEEKPTKTEPQERDLDYFMAKMRERVQAYHNQASQAEVRDRQGILKPEVQMDRIREAAGYAAATKESKESKEPREPKQAKQLDLFEEKLLRREEKAEYRIIGQVFDTYWLVEFHENLYIIDQHAAHERVLYEKTLKSLRTGTATSQYVSPPVILTLTMQEAELLETYMDKFTRLGFEIEPFGGESYAVRAVPGSLPGIAKKELLIEMLDQLSDSISTNITPDLLDEKVASMSCKAAVKGNSRLSAKEVDSLIGELLLLENPYHCPHGRPTIIAITKREMEKKFKRIV